MFDAIGDSAVRTMVRTESNGTVDNSVTAVQKIEKKAKERPVESSGESDRSKTDDSDRKKGSYKSDEQGVYFEKYDAKGNVIFRTPPEKRPIDQHV